MSLWIKICGNTSLEDARLAAEAGAEAVGFVFAPSPRRVTPEQAAAIVPHLPAALEKIGVFVDAALEEIAQTVETAGLTGVQLHWDAPPALAAQLRKRFGPKLRILGVAHFDAAAGERMAAIARDENIDALLLDSRTAWAAGGTGQTYDWHAARRSIFGAAGQTKLVAAGGLTPENVAEAIATLRPWGVDVVSGVEAAPGRKDSAKVRAFVDNVRGLEHDAWFRAKVQEALDDRRPDIPHEQVEAHFAKRRAALKKAKDIGSDKL
jgi:phosphoribosylanthranilate isomerase